MFEFLFGAKRRRRSSRKTAPRRRYKSSNSSCNRATKKACRKPTCTYTRGRKYYGCIAAPGFANAVSGVVPTKLIPDIAEQVDEVAKTTADAAIQAGANPAAVATAVGAAVADVVVANAIAAGSSVEQATQTAQDVADQAVQKAAVQVGLSQSEAAQVVAQTNEGIARATREIENATPQPPATPGSSKMRSALTKALQDTNAFGYRRWSRFGSDCTPFNNNEQGCLTKMVNNQYACIYKSNGSCSKRPNSSYKTREQLLEDKNAVNYGWYVRYFQSNNIAGLANVLLPPPPPPVAAAESSEPYIFGSAQMTGPGPGRSAKAVAAYCKRFNLNDCRQQLNCEVRGNSCRARRGAGARGYESKGLLPGTRWSGPINRPGYVRPIAPPATRPGRAESDSQTEVIRDPLFDYIPAKPKARSLEDVDSDDEGAAFGYRRKSRKVSLKALKAKCRRLGVRTTSGKTRKPKTISQLKRQCARKQRSARRAAPRRRKTTTRGRALPNCKGLTERMCGSNPNCQYTATGCRRRYGTVANKAVYQGPQLPGFGRRRCRGAPAKRRINSKSPCNRLKKKVCRSTRGCGYVSGRRSYGCKRKPVYASAFGF